MDGLVYLRDLDGTGSMHVCAKNDPGAIAYMLSNCPEVIKPREKFLDILGRENGYYESDEEWVKDNLYACVWFLTQQIGDVT